MSKKILMILSAVAVLFQSLPAFADTEDTYYAAAPSGYAVVTLPSATPAPVTVAPPKIESKSEIDSYEIHIPNDNGSYTLVILKKVEKGFVGPQGEYYPEHPTVEQLKALYGGKK